MRIRTAADTIVEHPWLYRAGRVAGTREMVVHPNYIVIYRIERAAIEIVDVIHARRNYP